MKILKTYNFSLQLTNLFTPNQRQKMLGPYSWSDRELIHEILFLEYL